MTDEREQLCDLLERVFENIQNTRMQDVPLLNRDLSVKAIGFEPLQNYRLGILMTPWMMNIMLIPSENSLASVRNGEKATLPLPSGNYEFVRAEETDLGPYLSCSLFSPVFEFGDQSSFEHTAEAALQALMQAENRETLGFEEWPSDEEVIDAESSEADTPPTEATQPEPVEPESATPEPVDRRGFLRRVGGTTQQSAAK